MLLVVTAIFIRNAVKVFHRTSQSQAQPQQMYFQMRIGSQAKKSEQYLFSNFQRKVQFRFRFQKFFSSKVSFCKVYPAYTSSTLCKIIKYSSINLNPLSLVYASFLIEIFQRKVMVKQLLKYSKKLCLNCSTFSLLFQA